MLGRRPKKNWDKLEHELKVEEKDEKLEGEAALHKLFRDIYSNADEDTRRAMNKSFQARSLRRSLPCRICFVSLSSRRPYHLSTAAGLPSEALLRHCLPPLRLLSCPAG